MSVYYDLASLVLVPSGYKASKIYAQKPLTTDGQLAFSRASTATRVNASGLIETVSSGVPRLDYQGSTCPKLLLEPQRTNYQVYSQDFTQWNLYGAATRTTGITDPAGGTTAARISNIPAGNYADGISLGSTVVLSNQTIRASVYLKGSGTIGVALERAFGGTYFFFQEMITLTSTWTRYDFGGTVSASNGFSFYISNKTGSTATSVDVAFAQVEIGAYATSYIPTTSAAVTRLADSASKTSASGIIGQTEGTIFWEVDIKIASATGLEAIVNIDNGSFGNTLYIYQTAGIFVAEVYVSGTGQAYFSKGSITAGVYKCALAYANNNTAFFVNGVQVGTTDTSCSIPATSRIQMGQTAISSDTSWTKQLLLFKTRLTNAQLAELTTL